jgi:hypothetical protein
VLDERCDVRPTSRIGWLRLSVSSSAREVWPPRPRLLVRGVPIPRVDV